MAKGGAFEDLFPKTMFHFKHKKRIKDVIKMLRAKKLGN